MKALFENVKEIKSILISKPIIKKDYENKYFIRFFVLIIFFLFFSNSFGNITIGSYPCVKKLNNNKYLVVHQKNITFFDEEFNNTIKEIYPSSTSKEYARSTTIYQFSNEDGNIIMIITFRDLYIFSQEGESLFKKENLNFLKTDNYYYIIPYNKVDNYHLIYIIYLDNSDHSPKFSKIIFDSTKNYSESIEIFSPEVLNLDEIETIFLNIDCTLMEYNNKKIITCFYGNNNTYICRSLDPEKNFSIINEKSTIYPVKTVNQRYFFKSKVLPGKERAIVCTYSKNDIFDCAWYDISTNSFYNYTVTEIKYNSFRLFSIFIEYFEQTHEILIGKPSNKGNISIIKCSKELECISPPYIEQLSGISFISRLNIILLPNENKYYAIVTDQDNPDNYKFELSVPLGLVCKYYYNYDKTSCLNNIPDGYFCNDTYNKSIDKCYSNCSTCNKESYDINQCKSCNNEQGYYPLYNETNNQYKSCYHRDTRFEDITLNLEKKIYEPIGYYLDKEDNLYKKCYESCRTCNMNGNYSYHNCITCNKDYMYGLELSSYLNCYQACEYYSFFDYNKNKYYCTYNDKCPDNMNKLIIEKKICIDDCSKDLEYKFEFRQKCYKECPKNISEKSEIKNNLCEVICTKEFPFAKIQTQECVNNCSVYELQNGLCKINIKYFNEENELQYLDKSDSMAGKINLNVYEQVINIILPNFDYLDNEEKIIRGWDNYYYEITTYENELDEERKKNNSIKFSSIDLGECETILREKNNLNNNISLLILKFEKISNISLERDLQFEVYESLTKKKLNLSVCQGIPININVPIVLSEKLYQLYNQLQDLGYNLFDINSEFYQDICTPYKSLNGTDVILSDRIEYYFNNKETQCPPNCKFSDYSFEKENLKCECNIISSDINAEKIQKVNSKLISQSFYDVLKFSNYKILKCYKFAFSVNIFKKNMGNIITLIFVCIYLILLLIYFIYGKKELINDLSKFVIDYKSEDRYYISKFINPKEEKCNNNFNDDYIKPDILPSKCMEHKTNNENCLKDNKKIFVYKKKIKKKKKKPVINFNSPSKRKLNIKFKNYDNKLSDNDKKSNILLNNIIKEDSNTKDYKTLNELKKNIEIYTSSNEKKLDNYELNNLDYDAAIKFDNRKYIEIYLSFLKREHLIIFTFFIKDDHNITYIKYERFIFIICTNMALNVFFFADETMHKMFLDYGKYNFIQQIPQIIYSTIVSQLIELLLCYLSLTDKHYYQIKNLNIKTAKVIFRIVKFINIKICIFFIFTGIMFFFYWYTITCFCAIYENTQKAFIKDSLFSFFLELLYPFVLYLLPSALRIIALKSFKLSFIYKLSDVIPIF